VSMKFKVLGLIHYHHTEIARVAVFLASGEFMLEFAVTAEVPCVR
jgi:hypothetical protein